MSLVNISPVQSNNPDYTQGTAIQLEVIGLNDNYSDSCTFQWYLKDVNGSVLDASSDAANNHVVCNGADYQNWYGGNSFPCQYVAQKKGFTIV